MLNVSIVIPAWNEEERINDCLLNATRQTVMPHEVIVVDNRSTDSTVAMVEQFIKDHPEAPVRLLHQDEEQGLIPSARLWFEPRHRRHSGPFRRRLHDSPGLGRSGVRHFH